MPKALPARPLIAKPVVVAEAEVASLPHLDSGAISRLRIRSMDGMMAAPKARQPQLFGEVTAPESRAPISELQPLPPKTKIAVQQHEIAPVEAMAEPLAVMSELEPVTIEPVQAEEPVVELPSAVHLPNIDMNLPGADSRTRQWGSRTRLKQAKRWAQRGAIGVIVLVFATGGVLFSQGFIKLHKVFHGGAAPVAALKVNVNPNQLKGEGDGRINILLLGRGGGTHEAPDLTDTIVLDSIDPVNHTQALVSIPRDLWVDVPNQGAMKINAAWETGEFKYLGKVQPGSTDPQAIQAGFDEVDQVVESVTGVTIDYNMIANFQAFKQAVTTVGGVTVTVPSDLIDPTMAWENGHSPIIAKAGVDSFDGQQALNYVRSRETTSDFARSQRQRAVLLALKSKVETLGTLSNPLKIANLLNAFGDNVKTDMSLSDATQLYSIIKDISDGQTKSIGFADPPNSFVTTGNMAGQSIDLPRAGLFNYAAIQEYLRTQLPDGHIIKENAPITILNGTEVAGLATTQQTILQSYGYNIVGAADAPTHGYAETQIIDLSHGKDPYTLHYLEQRFNTTATKHLPDNTIQTNGAAFVIIVGNDETASP